MGILRYGQSNISVKNIVQTKPLAGLTVGAHGTYFKTGVLMWTEDRGVTPPIFTRLYIDGVLSTFGVDWRWGDHPGPVGGFITDNVQVMNLAGATYRLEYTERHLPYVPHFKTYRQDGHRVRGGCIPNRVEVLAPLITWLIPWNITSTGYLEYRVEYRLPSGVLNPRMVNDYGCGTHIFATDFEKDALIADWRIELFKVGLRSRSAGASVLSAGGRKNGLTPALATDFNGVSIPDPITRGGIYLMRLRNTSDNTVTSFSERKLVVRKASLWQPGIPTDNFLGYYGTMRMV